MLKQRTIRTLTEVVDEILFENQSELFFFDCYKNKTWKNKEGEYHREDGPAVEWSDGYKAWYINGKLHREDGPAVECANGIKEWYLNGELQKHGKYGK